MPDAYIELDTSKFNQAVHFVFENTERALPEIINRAALVTIIGGKGVQGAMQQTMKAAASTIRAVPIKAVTAYIKRKNPIKYNLKTLDAAVKREYRRRVAAIGYTAVAGWAKAANDLGGNARERSGKGYASMGYAKPAAHGNYEAVIANTTPAAELIGLEPLQAALDDTSRDMIEFWEQKTGVIFKP